MGLYSNMISHPANQLVQFIIWATFCAYVAFTATDYKQWLKVATVFPEIAETVMNVVPIHKPPAKIYVVGS